MTKLAVYDPPMCCSTGVCGPAVDPVLPRVTADLDWLKRQGVEVERYNLAQQPQAFASNPTVTAALREYGNDCLPLVLVNGVIVSRGTLSRSPRPGTSGWPRCRLAEPETVKAKGPSCCSSPTMVTLGSGHWSLIGRLLLTNVEGASWSFELQSLEISSSPAKAAWARPRSQRHGGRPRGRRQASAAREYRPGLESR